MYRKELLDIKTSTMFVAETLRDQAKQLKMKAGTMGLAQGHRPHVRDAAELLQKAWASVTARDIARSGLHSAVAIRVIVQMYSVGVDTSRFRQYLQG